MGKPKDIAPRYNKRVDPLWSNENLLRNRSIIYSPAKYINENLKMSEQIVKLFEDIPKQLNVNGARKRESASSRLFSFETCEHDQLLHSIYFFTFDKTPSEIKSYKKYLIEEIGADKVHTTQNLMIVDFFNGLNKYNMLHLIEFITWMGKLNEKD